MDGLLRDLDDLSLGYFLGLLVGEGHFGGDGKQPQITLRMHVRHSAVFRWLTARFPGGTLYGPYHHGGRHYYQWMVRGAYLRRVVAPLIHGRRDWLDEHAGARFDAMCERYRIDLFLREPVAGAPAGARAAPGPTSSAPVESPPSPDPGTLLRH